jgi:hypothetical protein
MRHSAAIDGPSGTAPRKKRFGERRGAAVPGSALPNTLSKHVPVFSIEFSARLIHGRIHGRIDQLSRKCHFPIEFAGPVSSYMVARTCEMGVEGTAALESSRKL